MWNPGECRKCGIRASAGNVESGRVPEKVKILTSAGKVESGPVLKMWDPSEYQRRARVSTRRRTGEGVEFGRVAENHQTKRG